jgi:hypothetical protein
MEYDALGDPIQTGYNAPACQKPCRRPVRNPLTEYLSNQPKMLEDTPHKTAADVANALQTFIQRQEQHQNLLNNAANATLDIEATDTPLSCSGGIWYPGLALKRKSDNDVDDARPRKQRRTDPSDQDEYLATRRTNEDRDKQLPQKPSSIARWQRLPQLPEEIQLQIFKGIFLSGEYVLDINKSDGRPIASEDLIFAFTIASFSFKYLQLYKQLVQPRIMR